MIGKINFVMWVKVTLSNCSPPPLLCLSPPSPCDRAAILAEAGGKWLTSTADQRREKLRSGMQPRVGNLGRWEKNAGHRLEVKGKKRSEEEGGRYGARLAALAVWLVSSLPNKLMWRGTNSVPWWAKPRQGEKGVMGNEQTSPDAKYADRIWRGHGEKQFLNN